MTKMFKDYKTMVVEPKKEFNEMYKNETALLRLAVYAVVIGGVILWTKRENIKETIKTKFNRGNVEIEP
jgi:intergrase/recombinase